MSRKPSASRLRKLAKGASRVQADPSRPDHPVGKGELPDAEALISLSHAEHLTAPALARSYNTNAQYVYAVLEDAGRSKADLWSPPTVDHTARQGSPPWEEIQRDYVAGDATGTVAVRYAVPSHLILDNLKTAPDIYFRDNAEAAKLRSQQLTDATTVRYRLRTGALDAAAGDLGIDPAALRAALAAAGVLLPALDAD